MLSIGHDVFDVAVGTSTILTIRESSSNPRVFFLKNLYAGTLAILFKTFDGIEWSDYVLPSGGTTYNLEEDEIYCVLVNNNSGLIRIDASGGGGSKDLQVSYVTCRTDSTKNWSSPLV